LIQSSIGNIWSYHSYFYIGNFGSNTKLICELFDLALMIQADNCMNGRNLNPYWIGNNDILWESKKFPYCIATYKHLLKINKLYNCDIVYIVWRPITDYYYYYLQETFGTVESSIFPWKFLQIAETLFPFWEETMLIWSNTTLKQLVQSKSIAISPAQVPLNPRYVTLLTCTAEF